jgi:Flp pilus assembly protein TadD
LDAGIGELEEAVRLLPGHAELHSNLAFALGVVRDYPRALAEARKASQLDPSGTKTRYVLARVLMLSRETEDAGLAQLRMIAPEFPPARQTLADYYVWKGKRDAAEHERQASGGTPAGAGLGFQAPRNK